MYPCSQSQIRRVRSPNSVYCRVVIVLDSRAYVYNFGDLRLLDAMDTCNNQKGIIALNTDSENCVLATPGIQLGTVRVSLYGKKNKNYIFTAHETDI